VQPPRSIALCEIEIDEGFSLDDLPQEVVRRELKAMSTMKQGYVDGGGMRHA
jgi:hypothetical protein